MTNNREHQHVAHEGRKIGDELAHHHYNAARHEMSREMHNHPREAHALIKSINHELAKKHQNPLSVEKQHGKVSHIDFNKHDIYDGKGHGKPGHEAEGHHAKSKHEQEEHRKREEHHRREEHKRMEHEKEREHQRREQEKLEQQKLEQQKLERQKHEQEKQQQEQQKHQQEQQKIKEDAKKNTGDPGTQNIPSLIEAETQNHLKQKRAEAINPGPGTQTPQGESKIDIATRQRIEAERAEAVRRA